MPLRKYLPNQKVATTASKSGENSYPTVEKHTSDNYDL